MQILSDYTRDSASRKDVQGSYEWWYFDGVAKDGEYSFVIIFYDGNPFSRRYMETLSSEKDSGLKLASQYPALSISVYKKERPVYYGFREYNPEDVFFDKNDISGRAGNNEFRGKIHNGKLRYEVTLNQVLPNGDSINGKLKFVSDITNNILPNKNLQNIDNRHIWNLVQPQSQVEGNIQVDGYDPHTINFSGLGYHDHNLGIEPMYESFVEWYWGRFHFQGSTLIYYIMREKEGNQYQAWYLGKNGSCISLDHKFELTDTSLNLFGLNSSRKIIIEGNGLHCLVQQDRVIDNGPFYQRFSSSLVMKSEEGIQQSRGITEYIHPGRIGNRWFWPLVNMRIVYPGNKNHWVQRNPVLYRWTW
jgi:carotenoid 1,2-hydratase